ncbi:MAG TPA: PKD domain-containing protein, partial [Methanoregula sp.]|nr:PKD domain-containing protein [Methanoregula sp.]
AGGGGCGAGAVYSGAGGSGIVIIQYITPAPVASFTTNTTSGVSPLAVQFTDTSTNIPTSWSWKRSNLTWSVGEEFSTDENPVQSFVTGNWSINLTATNAAGSNLSTQITWINVSTGVTLPIVQWSVSKNTLMFYEYLTLNDTSLNTPTAWNYSMGDGNWYNTSDEGLKNHTYKYSKRGSMLVNLTVSNAAGSNTSADLSQTVLVIGYQGLPPNPGIWDLIDWLFQNIFGWIK